MNAHVQVSDHMDLDAEESDEAKIAALSEVHRPGDRIWVKVWPVNTVQHSNHGPKDKAPCLLGCNKTCSFLW